MEANFVRHFNERYKILKICCNISALPVTDVT